MKSHFDVVGSGEGISGLVACALLAHKGFSCLWADTGNDAGLDRARNGIPLLVSREFWDQGIRPLLSSMDTTLPGALQPRALEKVQAVVPGRRFDVGPAPADRYLPAHRRNAEQYLRLLEKSMTKPGVLLRASSRTVPEVEPWQKDQITALCRTGKPNYLSYLRWSALLSGLYSLDFTAAKHVLGAYLSHTRGHYLHAEKADITVENNTAVGLSLGNIRIRSRYCMSDETPVKPGQKGGFIFYGTCVVDEHVIPVGMGDMVIASPPEDMRFPLMLLLERRDGKGMVSVTAKIPVGGMLTSHTELLSWASGMIYKRLKQVMPFLEHHLISFDVVDPFIENSTRPWFRYADEMRVPWYVSGKRYMKNGNRMFICSGMKYGWLDMEGEILWGICMANAILKDLNRSDLIAAKMMVQASRV
ncbi:MAG: NAD(P)/FAD-dependent oxidoreductase [Deltaproteobacteria bacterium]|jgi:hypothetical protein|nr:NAD(P)/FAD-dependent oxidoreductase [Deltaproteobacteria bacterium]MDX9761635.1 NAD(P)/FAD-dependent oxidoreductase [Desulfomonilia bacterium]HPW69026.1 NAD(P)/FAD-dependent oxidoreductase [Deltaproteobacteria bacterium]